ncbi:hypothetical protein QVM88_08375 [Providencia stuartii]|nr:hypothetical protein [Providencia stuartii]
MLQRPEVIRSKMFFNDVLAALPGRKGFSDESFTFRGDGNLLLPFVHAITVNLQPPLTHQNGDVSSYRGTIQPGDITEPGKAYGIIIYHQLHQRILRNIDAIGIQLGVINSGHLTCEVAQIFTVTGRTHIKCPYQAQRTKGVYEHIPALYLSQECDAGR